MDIKPYIQFISNGPEAHKRRNKMIYIVEIPHQRKPFVWSALSENDFVSFVQNTHADTFIDNYDLACEVIASDLSDCRIYENTKEAIDACRNKKLWSGHGGYIARLALAKEIANNKGLE